MKNKTQVIVSSIAGICFCLLISSCQKKADAGSTNTTISSEENIAASYIPSQQWKDYWYKGVAELTSYELEQSRYGEIHKGTVVNIFVTEDFSKSKQVKLDNPAQAATDKISILKLNQSFKFNTGIYPYSMMLSSFCPIDINNYPHALKTSAVVEEWCGIAYTQLNNLAENYQLQNHSYFESEGESTVSLNKVLLEDELWNKIRLDPSQLPTGEHLILPGSLYLRLNHKPLEAVKATLSLKDAEGMKIYTIEYPTLNRTLCISFHSEFPYKITGWEDTYAGLNGKVLTTVASEKKTIMLDYWAKHNREDSTWRKALELPVNFQ